MMFLLSPILGLINGITVVFVNCVLVVSLVGKVIISAFEVLLDAASQFAGGAGVVFEEFRTFTLEQVFLLSSVKSLIDNIFYGIIKMLCDATNTVIEFLFQGKVQTKAVVTSLENGIIGLFSLISKALIWISEVIVALVVFFPKTAYRVAIQLGEIANYSSVKFTEFAVHVVKSVLRDIASYSLAMAAIFLILHNRRQIIRLGRNLVIKSIGMVSFD